MGTTYAVAALASSNLPVTIIVASSSASICARGVGSSVALLAMGTCVLNANQPGDGTSFSAAPQVQQSFAVQSLAAASSSAKLFGCTTSVTCNDNITGLLEGFSAIESNLTVLQSTCLSENCSATPTLPWLVPCTQVYVSCVLDLNAQRVANFGNMLAALETYIVGCLTFQCSTATSAAKAQYSMLMQSVALVCASPLCAMSNSAVVSAQRVFSGVPNAIQSEIQRFDADLLETSLGALYVDTLNYFQCLDGACRDKYYARVNESYAIRGYVDISQRSGMLVTNVSIAQSLLQSVDAAFLPCALAPCDGSNFSTILGTKRSYYAHVTVWRKRLSLLLQNCSGPCDRSTLLSLSATAQRNAYLASNYLPVSVSVAGIVVYAVVAVACIIVGVLAIAWQAFYGRLLFVLVLVAIFLAAVFRISFFAAALGSDEVQVQYLTFVVLDKIGLIFFCLAILCFAAMWSKAISILLGENAVLSIVIPVAAIVFGAAIFGIVIYFAVVVSVTYVTMFYYSYVTDYADIILSIITLFLAACLLVQILFVGSRIRQNAEKLRNIVIIAIGLIVMVLLLAERVVVVLIYNYMVVVSLGYGVYYGVATILPEFVVSAVMLAIVTFTFASHALSDSGTSTTKTTDGGSTELSDVRRNRYDTYK